MGGEDTRSCRCVALHESPDDLHQSSVAVPIRTSVKRKSCQCNLISNSDSLPHPGIVFGSLRERERATHRSSGAGLTACKYPSCRFPPFYHALFMIYASSLGPSCGPKSWNTGASWGLVAQPDDRSSSPLPYFHLAASSAASSGFNS